MNMPDMTINNFDDINLKTTVSLCLTVILWDLRQNNSLATLSDSVDGDHITMVSASLDDNSHSMMFMSSRPEKDHTNAGWYYNTIFAGWYQLSHSTLLGQEGRGIKTTAGIP
jgi:hypothetical protein